jgi:hypothetical protein
MQRAGGEKNKIRTGEECYVRTYSYKARRCDPT